MAKAIQVINISKAYQLGEIGTGTISRDLERFIARIRGKEDPFLKIGEKNDRLAAGKGDIVWSLKDLNFEIEKGDAVGIIGHNGAGKSTLLKLLSRVTAPTTGSIKIKGRIASLLEVGTGFHPDLTGKENVYLNGAILGMRKAEIKRKFDEIVDFSGVGRYIDTPVKRYSSGMYVRLAFAVAAHLDNEIMIVDEVLAVGDAEFQKKCLGKMGDVSSKEGRTVLFVSHNMDAMLRLCSHAILLKNGHIQGYSTTDAIVEKYLKSGFGTTSIRKWSFNNAPGDNVVKLLEVFVHDENLKPGENFNITRKIGITMVYQVLKENSIFTHGMNLFNSQGINILNSHDVISGIRKEQRTVGKYSSTMWIPENFLSEGIVIVGVGLFNPDPFYLHFQQLDAVAFNVYDDLHPDSARGTYVGGFPGVVRPILNWHTSNL